MLIEIGKLLENKPVIQDEDGYFYAVVNWTDMNMIALDPKFSRVIYGGNIVAASECNSKGYATFGVERTGVFLKHHFRLAVQIGGE